jgi:hypothetical protein
MADVQVIVRLQDGGALCLDHPRKADERMVDTAKPANVIDDRRRRSALCRGAHDCDRISIPGPASGTNAAI